MSYVTPALSHEKRHCPTISHTLCVRTMVVFAICMFLHFLDEAAAERKCQSINLSTTTTTVGGEQQGNTTHAREHKGKQTHEKKGANGHKHTETTTKKRNKKPRQNVRASNASLLCMHASVESSEPSKQVNAGCRHTFIQLDTFFSANERTCTYHALPYNLSLIHI